MTPSLKPMYWPLSEFQVAFELRDSADVTADIRYWYSLGEQVVGTRESSCSMSAAAASVDALVRYEGVRHAPQLAGMPLRQLHQNLYLGVLLDFDIAFEPSKDWQRHARFQALPLSAAFSGWSGFLVESADFARLIWMPPGRDATPREAYLPVGAFDAALRSFRQELQHLLARPSIPPNSGERMISPPDVDERGVQVSKRESAVSSVGRGVG